jgi:hypothetical protein
MAPKYDARMGHEMYHEWMTCIDPNFKPVDPDKSSSSSVGRDEDLKAMAKQKQNWTASEGARSSQEGGSENFRLNRSLSHSSIGKKGSIGSRE